MPKTLGVGDDDVDAELASSEKVSEYTQHLDQEIAWQPSFLEASFHFSVTQSGQLDLRTFLSPTTFFVRTL